MAKLRPLALVLVALTGPLQAQLFHADRTVERRMTYVLWRGLSGLQKVSIECGQGTWKPAYETQMEHVFPGRFQLGAGPWTALQTDVPLEIGKTKVPAGRWYLALQREGKDSWFVCAYAAERMDASGEGFAWSPRPEPELRFAMHFERSTELRERTEIELTPQPLAKQNLALGLAWGPFRMRGEMQAGFDTRQPAGAPALPAARPDATQTTASGLRYEVLRPGHGDSPKASEQVRVHYAGWLPDGSLFDSSWVDGAPYVLPVGAVVPGFSEALQLMQPGALFRLSIPPALAYGERGAGDRVGPNTPLTFVVNLLEIVK